MTWRTLPTRRAGNAIQSDAIRQRPGESAFVGGETLIQFRETLLKQSALKCIGVRDIQLRAASAMRKEAAMSRDVQQAFAFTVVVAAFVLLLLS